MYISLKGPTGNIKQVKLGISWTFFFFSILVPLVRGDLKGFFIVLACCVCTFGLASLYFWFKYNEMHAKSLMSKGYVPADQMSADILKAKGMHA